ncbi:MAG: DedA family protein, partial [Ignavibacteria bacterium]|nr:DedA family protein [Ignavibacteria bacterium]
ETDIIPPFPSDVVVAIAGSFAAFDKVVLPIIIFLAVAGSTLGFLTMYIIGKAFGNKILEKGKIKFISIESVRKVELWFNKYGYWLVAANRFLAGTRAVISFFAGLSELDLKKTTILSAVSALCWNLILIYIGFTVGNNLSQIMNYISTYNKIVIVVLILAVLFFSLKYLYKKIKPKKI